jgi:hypothetical protein
MACPKCGSQILPEQKFCRSCGASVQVTTNPLIEPAQFGNLEITSTSTVKAEAQRTRRFMLWGFIAMLVGVAIGVIGKKLLQEDLIAVIGILISLVGMFLSAYPHLVPSDRGTHATLPPQPERLTPAHPPKALPKESPMQYVPSITERTTNLLRTPEAATPRQKEDEGSHS